MTLPMFYYGKEDLMRHDFGVCHADELFVLFRQEFLGEHNEIIKGADTPMIKKMIRWWTSFATTSQPDPDWPRLTKDKHEFAVLNSKPIKMLEDKELNEKVTFVSTMKKLNEDYKGMDFMEHPAIKEMMDRPVEEEDHIDLEEEGYVAPDAKDEL